MVRHSTKLLFAALVLGAMNQACAVGGGARNGAYVPTAKTVGVTSAATTAAVAETGAPVSASTDRPALRTTDTDAAPSQTDSVSVSPLADPAGRAAAPDRLSASPSAASPIAPAADTTPKQPMRVIATIPPSPSQRSAAPAAPAAVGVQDTSIQPANLPDVAPVPTPSAENTPPPPDPHARAVYENLWARMRAGFTLPNLESPLVERQTEWYASRPEYVQRVVERGRRYMHFVVEELEKRGMPLEIALLPIVESAYNPTAYSKAHASGIWQFIPATGKTYGLTQNWWYDGRRDVTAATRAALDYLQNLHEMFGDWRLALAAYNWGEGAVGRAIERNQRKGLPTDYESLAMPAETRNYVPKLQAVKNIISEPERYGLALDDVPNEPYFIRVAAPGQIDFKRAAQLAEVPLEEFRSLNPAHNRPVITSNGGSFLIPADKAEVFNANLNALQAPLVTWQTYRLTRSERLEAVAARFGTTATQLRLVNGITHGRKMKAGSTLLVPIPGGHKSETVVAAQLDTAAFRPPEAVTEVSVYRAHAGDTLRGIASRHGITVQQLMAWNHLRTARVRAGQLLRLNNDTKIVTSTGAKRSRAPVASEHVKARTKSARASAAAHPVREARARKSVSKTPRAAKAPVNTSTNKQAGKRDSCCTEPGRKEKLAER